LPGSHNGTKTSAHRVAAPFAFASQCAEVFVLPLWGIAVPLGHSRRLTAADHVQAGAERDDISPIQVGLLSL
jgi:hypothetical protein